jgi:hypothetical protein
MRSLAPRGSLVSFGNQFQFVEGVLPLNMGTSRKVVRKHKMDSYIVG